MKTLSFSEVETIIFGLKRSRADYTLSQMRDVLKLLGDPQEKVPIIHVAGTSGKTSTSYFAAALLKASGKRVGLTVSPHVESVRDRAQIDLAPLSEKRFAQYFSRFWDIVEPAHLELSYFEVLVAFAYWVFAEEAVDYAVIEVGIGGLLDATNIVKSPNKVCVITDIGMDHVAILGNTIAEIAKQKAGIIQNGNHVTIHEQGQDVMDAVRARVLEARATLGVADTVVPSHLAKSIKKLPLYQQRNWLLAYNVWQYVAKRDGLNESIDFASTMLTVPGRLETYEMAGKTIILDGAHNPQKAEALARSLRAAYPGKQFLLGIAVKEDKDYVATLNILLPFCTEVVGTTMLAGQDIVFSTIESGKIAQVCKKHKVAYSYEPDQSRFLDMLFASSAEYVLITGSLYLVSDVRALLKQR